METETSKNATQILFTLVMRTVLFFVLFLSALLVFYTIGNYQEFLDENQHIILAAATVTAIPLLFFSAAGIAVSIVLAVKNHERRTRAVVSAVCSFFACAYGFTIMLATRLIDFLAGGA